MRGPEQHLHVPKRGYGWDAVARAIVTDMADLLPPRAPNCRGFLSATYHYRKDGSLVIDTYEGRWRDGRTGEGGTVFTLLVRLLGSWGSARSWLRRNGYMHALGPGPRREPGGSRRRSQKGRTGNAGPPPGEDRFWNPVQGERPEVSACPAPPPVDDQLELWPDESAEMVIQRNRAGAARHRAEEERRWEEEMAKLSPGERNYKEAQRWKRRRRYLNTER